jgi:hypothetical protein
LRQSGYGLVDVRRARLDFGQLGVGLGFVGQSGRGGVVAVADRFVGRVELGSGRREFDRS